MDTSDHENATRMSLSAFWRRSLVVSACALAVLTIAWFAQTVAHAALLIFAAFLVAVGLDGLARLTQRIIPWGRHTAVVITTSVLALVLGFSIAIGAINIASQAPKLKTQVAQSIDKLQSKLDQYQITEHLLDGSLLSSQQASDRPDTLGEQLTSELSNAASVTLTTLTDTFVILIIGVYLALQPALYRDGLMRLFPPTQRDRAKDIANEATDAVRRWLTGRVVSMSVVAVASAAGLAVIGIPFAFLLGLSAGLLTFIPYLGALVSAVPALLVAGLHGYWPMIYVGSLYIGLHIIEGYLLAPLIQKRAVSIAPGFLLSVQVLGGAVAGVLGVALATPIALVIAVVVQLAYIRDVIGETPHLPGDLAKPDTEAEADRS
ncbi:AI-2E family transporter [Salinisphaera sp. Q1T1-3]|uniref:AI-2E family transporter n=1 Tax=Salinisphaera sp. Q1T1-3 TaxID=2321229 RepID=UPI000E7667D4|nr:AI-2E family transporter [Salinisphaera sp. Q1T1-3]RJS93275.1 AI-2E family transporter [Salinisphaera sp. Q1T1-3]